MPEIVDDNIVGKVSLCLLGANYTTDFLLRKESLFSELFVDSFIPLVDRRLFKRIILSGYSSKEANDFIKSNSLSVSNIRILSKFKYSSDLVLIDSENSFIFSEDNNRISEINLDNDKDLLNDSNLHFDFLWNNSESIIFYESFDNLYLPEKNAQIIIATTDLYDKLISELAKNPTNIYKISPFDFEEVVARLLKKNGYDVQVTPKIKDGGKDIIARFKTPTGENLLCLVECKRNSPDRPIGVGLIRALYGVVESERANLGMLVTTSSFTKGSFDFQKKHNSHITLKDLEDLKAWLSNETK